MRSAALALAAAALLASGCAKPQPWAPVKRRLCGTCRPEKLPFNVPARGAALGFQSYEDGRASWIVVDLDRRALNRMTMDFDVMSNARNLLTRKEEPLGERRERRLVELADFVWASDLAVPMDPGPPGIAWDLYLFDGKDLRHDFGAGRPGGAGAELAALLAEPPAGR